jgi:hypothetical protein
MGADKHGFDPLVAHQRVNHEWTRRDTKEEGPGVAAAASLGPYGWLDGRRRFRKPEPLTSDLADHSDALEGKAGSESLICGI